MCNNIEVVVQSEPTESWLTEEGENKKKRRHNGDLLWSSGWYPCAEVCVDVESEPQCVT